MTVAVALSLGLAPKTPAPTGGVDCTTALRINTSIDGTRAGIIQSVVMLTFQMKDPTFGTGTVPLAYQYHTYCGENWVQFGNYRARIKLQKNASVYEAFESLGVKDPPYPINYLHANTPIMRNTCDPQTLHYGSQKYGALLKDGYHTDGNALHV